MSSTSLNTFTVRREFLEAEHVLAGEGAPTRTFPRALVAFAVGAENVDSVERWCIDQADDRWFIEVDETLYVYDASSGDCEDISRPCGDCNESGIATYGRGPMTWVDYCACEAGDAARDDEEISPRTIRAGGAHGWKH